jgi:hypothetical protein
MRGRIADLPLVRRWLDASDFQRPVRRLTASRGFLRVNATCSDGLYRTCADEQMLQAVVVIQVVWGRATYIEKWQNAQ